MPDLPPKDLRPTLGYTRASNFFLTFWAPVLGPGPSMLYLQLRKRCLDDKPFRATNRALMAELGISDFHTFYSYQKRLESSGLIMYKVVQSGSSRLSRETRYYIEEIPPFLEARYVEKLSPFLRKYYQEFLDRTSRIFLDQLLNFTMTERSFSFSASSGSAVESTSAPAVHTTAAPAVNTTADTAVFSTAVYNTYNNDYTTTLKELTERFPKFRGLRPQIFSELASKYGVGSVCEAVEVLSYNYRNSEIRSPSALLRKSLSIGVEITESFVSYKRSVQHVSAENDRHRVQEEEDRLHYEEMIAAASRIELSQDQNAALLRVIDQKYRSIPKKIRYDSGNLLMAGIYAKEKLAIYNGGNGHEK